MNGALIWDFKNCGFITEFNPLVREARHGADLFYFSRGDKIEAQAEYAPLESFIASVRKGPSFSVVADLDITPLPESDSHEGFELKW